MAAVVLEVTVVQPFLTVAYSSSSTLKLEVVTFSEILVINYQSARHHIPDDYNCQLVCTLL